MFLVFIALGAYTLALSHMHYGENDESEHGMDPVSCCNVILCFVQAQSECSGTRSRVRLTAGAAPDALHVCTRSGHGDDVTIGELRERARLSRERAECSSSMVFADAIRGMFVSRESDVRVT